MGNLAKGQGSIRRRLLFTLLGGVLLIWLFATISTVLESRREMQELLDAHLAQSASLLSVQIGHEIGEIDQEHAQPLHRYARNVAFQIWEDERILRLHSADAPAGRLSQHNAGFDDVRVADRHWRVYSLWDPTHRYLIQVGEAADARDHLAHEIMEKLAFPLVLSIPVLGLLIWIAVGAALRPVDRIGASLSRRDPQHLEPIDETVPVEIRPMVERLNTLLGRVRTSLENERRFTSDAAHELRTPLAGIKTQLQVALGATDEIARQRAIGAALSADERAVHLVEQLLTLARLEHTAWPGDPETVDIHDLAAQVLAELAPQAADKGVGLVLSGQSPVSLQARPGLLGILIRNLVDNAVRYSPPDTEVEVHIEASDGRVVLEVRDQGPGIPGQAREAVLQRFHRLADEDVEGSGLGLSIVARIAALHHASLQLLDGTDGRGLRVRVVF